MESHVFVYGKNNFANGAVNCHGFLDWEAIADRAPDELISPQRLPEVSKLSLYDTEVKKVPNRRGRGTFTYKKQGLYSDEKITYSIASDASDEIVHDKSEKISEARNCE